MHISPPPALDPNRLLMSPCRKTSALYNERLAGKEAGRQAYGRQAGKAEVQSENMQTDGVVYLNASRESSRSKVICAVVIDRRERDRNRSVGKNATKASSKNDEKCLGDLAAIPLE